MIQYCLSFPKNWKHIEFIIFSIHKNFGEGKGERNIYVFHLLPTHSSLLRFFFPQFLFYAKYSSNSKEILRKTDMACHYSEISKQHSIINTMDSQQIKIF